MEVIHSSDCTIFLDEIQNEPDDSIFGRKKGLSRGGSCPPFYRERLSCVEERASEEREGLSRGGSCLLGQEKAWAAVMDGSLERRKRRSAQCAAVCAIWKKVYICRRIGEIDDASIR